MKIKKIYQMKNQENVPNENQEYLPNDIQEKHQYKLLIF